MKSSWLWFLILVLSITARAQTIVQETKLSDPANTTSRTLQFSSNITAGHALVGLFCGGSGSTGHTPTAVSDNIGTGQTWTCETETNYAAFTYVKACYFENTAACTAGGSNCTVTVTTGSDNIDSYLFELSGVPTSSIVDTDIPIGGCTGSACTSGFQSGSYSTSANNELGLFLSCAGAAQFGAGTTPDANWGTTVGSFTLTETGLGFSHQGYILGRLFNSGTVSGATAGFTALQIGTTTGGRGIVIKGLATSGTPAGPFIIHP